MRNAPSVSYPVGRSAFQAGVIVVLGLLGALALLLPRLWCPAVPGWVWAVGAILWLLWCAWAGLGWRRTPSGRLHWDVRALPTAGTRAGVWRWLPDGAPAVELQALDWVWDAQVVVLARPHSPGQRVPWLWLEGWREPARWDDLRRALTAHAGHRPPP